MINFKAIIPLKILYVFLILFFLFSFSSLADKNDRSEIYQPQDEPSLPAIPVKEINSEMHFHEKINIQSNRQFFDMASSENWPGDGSLDDPYIIENYKIDGDASLPYLPLVAISNVNYHFIVRNNVLSAHNFTYSGISLDNTQNGLIYNNSISQTEEYGILLINSVARIENNRVNISGFGGIAVKNSNSSVVRDNLIISASSNGIMSAYSSWIKIYNNTIINNSSLGGIYVIGSQRHAIAENNLSNVKTGVYMVISNTSDIRANTIKHSNTGMFLQSTNLTLVVENEIDGSSNTGLLFLDNLVNQITRNTISNISTYGVDLRNSNTTTIDSNILQNNTRGIGIFGSSSNSIYSNTFINSSNYGIIASSGDQNSILWNNFINTTTHVYDQATSTFFSNNFYYDFTSPDSNNDEIVDNSFQIGGSAGNEDLFPMVIPHTLSFQDIPTFAGGGIFSGSTLDLSWSAALPSYTHTVQYEILFSIDGGITWNSTGITTTATSATVDISDVPNTDDFLFQVIAIDSGYLQVQRTILSTITIANPIHTLTTPTVSSPNGGELASGDLNIMWSDSSDSEAHSVSYDLFYSDDNGTTWNLIVADLMTTSYTWDTTTSSNGDGYLIKVVASDGFGLESWDRTNKPFEIYNDISTNPLTTSITTSPSSTTSTSLSSTTSSSSTTTTSEQSMTSSTTSSDSSVPPPTSTPVDSSNTSGSASFLGFEYYLTIFSIIGLYLLRRRNSTS